VPFAQSEELLAALKDAGVDALLQPFPNAGHGGTVFHKPEGPSADQGVFRQESQADGREGGIAS